MIASCGITGGFIWLFDHIYRHALTQDYANAINLATGKTRRKSRDALIAAAVRPSREPARAFEDAVLPVALRVKPRESHRKGRIVPAPQPARRIMDQPQGAQRLDQVQLRGLNSQNSS